MDAPAPRSPAPWRQLARDLLRELVETDTTHASGSTTAAAEAVAARLRGAGLPEGDVGVLEPHPRKGNLVARLRGTGARGPLLLLAHLDVVDAVREEWSVEPFTLLERGGHFYGRGTLDDKAMAALWAATLVRLRREGLTPARDLIVALTADEEGGEHNGARWLLEHHRGLVEAELGLNEGGYGRTRGGRRVSNQVQAAEKVGLFVQVEATGREGHSSLPSAEGAIPRLVRALGRLERHRFPARLTEAARAFFGRMAEIETGRTAADMRALLRDPPDPGAVERLSSVPYYHALLHTTCAATRLEAGHAPNVLPRTARAVLDCRVLPGDAPEEVLRTLAEVVGDPQVELRPLGDPLPGPPSPLTRELLGAMERVTAGMWPGVPVVPVMSVGATDSLHFRRAGIPMYGVSGIFLDVDDVRAHAADERIGVRAFYEAQEFLYRLVRELAGAHAEAP